MTIVDVDPFSDSKASDRPRNLLGGLHSFGAFNLIIIPRLVLDLYGCPARSPGLSWAAGTVLSELPTNPAHFQSAN